MPSDNAAAVSTLRRGRRVNESATRRRNMGSVFTLVGARTIVPLLWNLLRRLHQRRNVQDEISAVKMRRHSDWIAASCFPDRRYINRRGAMPANDILPILAITLCSTDAASVQRRAIAIRLFDDHETQRLPSCADREQMHFAILHFA